MPARLINIKYITIRAEKVASPVTALQSFAFASIGSSVVSENSWIDAIESIFSIFASFRPFFRVTTELPTDANANDKTQKLSKAELEAFHADYSVRLLDIRSARFCAACDNCLNGFN